MNILISACTSPGGTNSSFSGAYMLQPRYYSPAPEKPWLFGSAVLRLKKAISSSPDKDMAQRKMLRMNCAGSTEILEGGKGAQRCRGASTLMVGSSMGHSLAWKESICGQADS